MQVSTDALKGDIGKNPYNFKGFGLKKLHVLKEVPCVNAVSLPLPTGFVNDDDYLKLWDFSQQAVNSPHTFPISRKDFKKGYMITVVDLTPDGSATDILTVPERGNVKIKIDYEKPLTEDVSLICIWEFAEELTLDSQNRFSLNGWPC
jgi:hypothetical protein